MSLAVVILAGGKATRMGGGDKPLKTLKGVPILSHVLARVARNGRALVLNANGDASRFAPFGLPVVADAQSDFPGPLAGILAGLDWAAEQGITGDVLSVPGIARSSHMISPSGWKRQGRRQACRWPAPDQAAGRIR